MFRLVWKRIFLGENMILPSCKIQYTKTNRKIAKWKKSKKPDFSKNLPWVFARLVRKTKKIHQRHLLTLKENKKKPAF